MNRIVFKYSAEMSYKFLSEWLKIKSSKYQESVKYHKVNHSKDQNFPPVTVTFFGQVNSTAFFNGDHSDNKEESAYTIKVKVG